MRSLPLLLLTVLLFHAAAGAATTPHRTVVVGVYQNEPKIFLDAARRPSGFFAELLDAAAAAEGWKLEYRPCSWDGCLQMLEEGEIDIMPDVAYTPERTKRFDFGEESLFSSWSVLYRREGSAIDSIFDLERKRIAVLKGSIQAAAIKERIAQFGIAPVHYVSVDSFADAFGLLALDKVDCVLTNRFYGAAHYREYGAEATNILIMPSVVKFAFAPAHGDLRDALDRRLRAYKNDPGSVFYAARARWLDAEPKKSLPTWIFWILAGSLLLALLVAALIALLRRLVAERSRELVKTSEEMQYLADHDELTALPNRMLFKDRLNHAVAFARRSGRPLAVVFFNIDNFKEVNDALDHEAGDTLLRLVADLLTRELRDYDTVARFGGDEFVAIADADERLVPALARIGTLLKEPFTVSGQHLYVTLSMGIARFPEDGDEAAVLLKNANTALHRAKSEGKGQFYFYTGGMTEQAHERMQTAARLRAALEEGNFEVYYQPKIDAATFALTGAEALLRWNDPQLGAVSPELFIPLAEEHGLIDRLGAFVLERAMGQFATWRGDGLEPGVLAVNVSMMQLRGAHFTGMLETLLERYGFASEALEIELTESQLMHDPHSAIEMLQAISAMGVGIAVDDFGTGYSSLSYLKRLPISVLKIDRSFIRDIPGDPGDVAITRAIIALAGSLGLITVAEGVETPEQELFLKQNGCDRLQGYYYYRPMDAPAMHTLLLERSRGA